ncbi:MAG: hypothetical protein HRT47_11050 [Candidatus Caenarcaniphilales bacterium]|nr:hypothetical protein [Candidatus Caenarcaniphilales bacterium]
MKNILLTAALFLRILIPAKAFDAAPIGEVKAIDSESKPILYKCSEGVECIQKEGFRIIFKEFVFADFKEINDLGSSVFLRFQFPENIYIKEASASDFSDLFTLNLSTGFETVANPNSLINQINRNADLSGAAFIDISVPPVEGLDDETLLRTISLAINSDALVITPSEADNTYVDSMIVTNEGTATVNDDVVISQNSSNPMVADETFLDSPLTLAFSQKTFSNYRAPSIQDPIELTTLSVIESNLGGVFSNFNTFTKQTRYVTSSSERDPLQLWDLEIKESNNEGLALDEFSSLKITCNANQSDLFNKVNNLIDISDASVFVSDTSIELSTVLQALANGFEVNIRRGTLTPLLDPSSTLSSVIVRGLKINDININTQGIPDESLTEISCNLSTTENSTEKIIGGATSFKPLKNPPFINDQPSSDNLLDSSKLTITDTIIAETLNTDDIDYIVNVSAEAGALEPGTYLKVTTEEEAVDEVTAPVADDGSFNASLRVNNCNLGIVISEFPKDNNTENGNSVTYINFLCDDKAINFYNFPESIDASALASINLYSNAGSRVIMFEEPETGGFSFSNLVEAERVFINNSLVKVLNDGTYYSVVKLSNEYKLSIYSNFEKDIPFKTLSIIPPDLIEADINISDEVESNIFEKGLESLRIKRKKKDSQLVMFQKKRGVFKKPKFPGDLSIEVIYDDGSSGIVPTQINRRGTRIRLEIDEGKTPVLIQLSSAVQGSLAREFPEKLRN